MTLLLPQEAGLPLWVLHLSVTLPLPQEAGLPLWLRPYEVLVTSNRTALIEMVPNAPSLHTIKSRSPPGTSLAAHFFAKFGRVSPLGFTLP